MDSLQYQFYNHGNKYIYLLNINNKKRINLTANHRLFTVDGWIRLDHITKGYLVGTVVADQQSSLLPTLIHFNKIEFIKFENKSQVYDLAITLHKNFIANEIVIHNSIEQDADLVCMLYRDEYYHPQSEDANRIEVIVAKHRNGPVGNLKLWFNTNIMSFENDTNSEAM